MENAAISSLRREMCRLNGCLILQNLEGCPTKVGLFNVLQQMESSGLSSLTRPTLKYHWSSALVTLFDKGNCWYLWVSVTLWCHEVIYLFSLSGKTLVGVRIYYQAQLSFTHNRGCIFQSIWLTYDICLADIDACNFSIHQMPRLRTNSKL